MPASTRLAVPLLLLAGLACLPASAGVVARPALAQSEALDKARAELLELIGGEMQMLARAKRVKRLAVFDSPEAMTALLEGLGVFTKAWSDREVAAKELYRTFTENGYDKFTSNGDPRFWDRKKELTERIERQDAVLREDAGVARVFVAAIAKLGDAGAIDRLAKDLNTNQDDSARRILYEGLLNNPKSDDVDLAKKGLKDSDPGVRLAVLNGLMTRSQPDLVPLVVKALKETGWPHRQAAAQVLGHLGDVRAVAPLVSAMGQEEGRLVEDYAEALAQITGQKLGPNPESWKAWYEDNKDKLIEQGAKKETVKRPKKVEREVVNYYGIQTRSKRIVFIIDISGSMKEIIGEETKGVVTGEQGDSYNGPKIEIAKKTLKQAIRALSGDTYFNIVVYNHGVQRFQETMLKADQEGKNQSYLMINDLKPSGATYTYGALKEAFLMAGRGVTDKAYDPGVDTIFLLSDGAPTDNDAEKAQPMEGDQILDAVDEWNRLSRVQVHTIAIDPKVATGRFIKFMKSLAHRNRGTYTTIPPQK